MSIYSNKNYPLTKAQFLSIQDIERETKSNLGTESEGGAEGSTPSFCRRGTCEQPNFLSLHRAHDLSSSTARIHYRIL